MNKSLYFLPSCLETMRKELLPFEVDGKFFSGKEIREINDSLAKLAAIAEAQFFENHMMRKHLVAEQEKIATQHIEAQQAKGNVVPFPKNSLQPVQPDGAA